MPTVYEGKMDGSNAVRYFHYSLIRFYLDQGYEHAFKAKEECRSGVLQASSIIGIMFSVMAIEAFINETSEDLLESDKLNDFMFLRRGFKKTKGESSVVSKLGILFDMKFGEPLKQELADEVELSVKVRNNLVHYKLSELAGKHILPPIRTIEGENGQFMSCVDFTVEPERIDPPFISKVSGKEAARCFNSALAIVNYWGELMGVKDNVPGLEKIV